MKAGFIATVFMVWFAHPSSAQNFIAPGDTGSIEYTLQNDPESIDALENVRLLITPPAQFHLKESSVLGPFSIAIGESKTFVVEYEIAVDAPDGEFQVVLVATTTTTNIEPDLSTLDTQVSFTVDRTSPTMEFIDPGAVALHYGWATESLTADVRVMDAGSGVAGLQIYLGDPDKGGALIDGKVGFVGPNHIYTSANPTPENQDIAFLGALFEGEFYLVASDQAGNKTKKRLAVDRTPAVVTLMEGELGASGFEGLPVGLDHMGDQTSTAALWVHKPAQGFRMRDWGGVIGLKIYRDTGVEDYSQPVSTITDSFVGMVGMLPDRKDYVAAFWDVLGHVTMFKFSQDKTWPKTDLAMVKISEQDGQYYYAISGTATDGLSGVSSVTLPSRNNVAPVALPGTLSATFSLPAVLVTQGMQDVALYDVAGNLGRGAVVSGGTTSFTTDLSMLSDDANTSVSRDVIFAGGSRLDSVSASIENYDILPPSPVRCETAPADVGKVQVYAKSDYNDWPEGTAPEATIEPIVPQTPDNLVLDYAGMGSQTASLNAYVGQKLTLRAVRSPGASGCQATDGSTIEAGRIYPVATIHAGGEGLVMTAVDEVIAQHVDPYSNVFMNFPKEGITLSLDYVTRPGDMSVIVIPGQFAPPGYTTVAPGSAWDITTTAEFTGMVTITAKYDPVPLGLDLAAQNRIHMFHHSENGDFIDIPVIVDTVNRTVTGQVTHLSLFTLGAANEDIHRPDTTPPETALSYAGPLAPDISGDPIISKYKTSLVLAPSDPVIPEFETSGVSTTFVLVDLVPSDCGFAWGGDPPVDIGAEAGTCENPVYGGPLYLPAGVHQIRYGSKDSAGNMEQMRIARVLVDDLSPETSPSFEGSTAAYSGGGTVLAEQARTGFLALDPAPAGFAAGAATTYYLIDSSHEDCGFVFNEEPPIDPDQPSGTCQNPLYSGPFSLNEGRFELTYFSVDRMGNIEFYKTTTTAVDATPPFTRLELQGPFSLDSQGLRMVSADTGLTLPAWDPESNNVAAGVARTMYFIDTPPTPGVPANLYSGQPFSLAEGMHTVYFRSKDWVNNFEAWHSTMVSADTTPPVTMLSVQGSSSLGDGGETLLAADAYIVLEATDPLSNGVSAGLAGTFYLIDATLESCAWGSPPEFDLNAPPGTCLNPFYSGPFHMPPGRHTLGYMSMDRVNNAEAVRAVTIVVDDAGPVFSSFQTGSSGSGVYTAEGSVIVAEKADARVTVVDADQGLQVSGPGAAPNLPSDLVAWWRFEGNFTDSSGNGNDLTAQGVAQTTTMNKRFGNAAYYNNGTAGARGYRDSLIGWPGGNRDITLSAWVYHTGNPNLYSRGIAAVGITSAKGHFYIRGFSAPQWGFPTCTVTRAFAVAADDGSADNWVCGKTPSELGQWFHVVATYSSSTYRVKLYVNGRLDQEQALSAPLNLGTQVQIGGDLHNDSWIYGYVDDVAMFGRALSDAEIVSLYQMADTGKPYSARISRDGGQTFLAIPSGDMSLTGTDGGTAPQVLSAAAIPLVQSVSFGDPTNQLAITATDMSGNTATSTRTIIANLNPLISPVLEAPYPGLLVRTPDLSWRVDFRISTAALTGVEVLLSRSADFADPLLFTSAVSTLSMTVGPLDDGRWYWKVRTKDGFGGYSPYSSSWTFILDSVPPQLESPQIARSGGVYGDFDRFLSTTAIDVRAGVSDAQSGLTIPYRLPTGTIAYLPFDEGAGKTAYDVSGNRNHGTLLSSYVSWSTSGCRLGGCVTFTPLKGSSIWIAPSATMRKDAFTFSAWIQATGTGYNQQILSWQKGDFVDLAILNGKLRVYAPNMGFRDTGIQLRDHGWVHVAVTHDVNTVKVYANGAFVASYADYTTADPEDIFIGSSWNELGGNFEGRMDEVKMFGVAASAAEIRRIYEKTGVPDPAVVSLSTDGGLTFQEVSSGTLSGAIGSVAGETISASNLPVRESPDAMSPGNLVRLLAQDVAGNVTTYSFGVFVDTTPPVSSLLVSGSSREVGGRRYMLGQTPLSISAVDSVSGVKESRHRIDSEPYGVSTGEFLLPHGKYDISFFSTDQAGNSDPVKTAAIKIDETAPGPITDLLAVVPSTFGMTLTWTAPGDDGVAGAILSGELRVQYGGFGTTFSTGQAQIVEIIGDQEPGADRSMRIEGLSPGTDYDFAMWIRDTAGHYSSVATAAARTLSIAQSVDQVASLVSPEPAMTVTTIVETVVPEALSISATQGLETLTQTFYELNTPTGEPVVFSTPAVISFVFDGTGIDPYHVAIFKYMDEDGDGDMEWSRAPIVNQTLTALGGTLYQISGEIYSASLYSAFEVQDILPARTTLAMGPPNFTAGETYLTSATKLSFSAVDDRNVVGDGQGNGVARIEYAVDGGAGTTYTAPVTLSGEGAHDIAFFSVDIKDHVESPQSRRLVVDDTPPVAAVSLSTPSFETFLSPRTTVKLSAQDPPSGVAPGSGLAQFLYSIGDGQLVQGPLEFGLVGSDGKYRLNYQAKDNLGNLEPIQKSEYSLDGTPPLSASAIGSPSYTAPDGKMFISILTPLTISSQDPSVNEVASGIMSIEVDLGQGYAPYTTPLTLAEGQRRVLFRAVDKVGNSEEGKSEDFLVDGTPPATLAVIGMPSFIDQDGKKYASPLTPITFTAEDPTVDDVASGLKRIEVDLGQGFVPFQEALRSEEGSLELRFRSQDNVDNLEQAKSLELYCDGTTPITAIVYDGFHLARADNPGLPPPEAEEFISVQTKIILTAQDPGTDAVSGVKLTEYRLDDGAWVAYSAPFSITAEGLHTLAWRSKDQVENEEAVHSVKIAVMGDIQPPRTVMSIGTPKYVATDTYLTSATELTLTAVDDRLTVGDGLGLGVEKTEYSLDAGVLGRYAAPIKLSGNGPHDVAFFSTDVLGHAEASQSRHLLVDDAPPITELVLSGLRFTAQSGDPYAVGGPLFIASTTLTALQAQDPLVNGSASGLASLSYGLDTTALGPYSAAFTVTTQGAHALKYLAVDNLGNAENLKTVSFSVDAAPPVTQISFTGPYFMQSVNSGAVPLEAEVFISRETRIVLTAQDPVVAETASGVSEIRYRLNGGAWQAYSQSLAILSGGLHTLEWYAKDRLGLEEAVHSLRIAVDVAAPISSLSIGEPKFLALGLDFVTPQTPIALSAVDLPNSGIAVGVQGISYRIDAGTEQLYTASFTLAQGTHTIEFWAYDRSGNVEYRQSRILTSTLLQTAALTGVDGITGSGTAQVTGKLLSNGRVALSGSVRVLGDAAGSPVALTGNASVSGIVSQNGAGAMPEPIDLSLVEQLASAASSNVLIPASFMKDGALVVTGNKTLLLAKGTYVLKGLTLSGGASLDVAGPVRLFLDGPLQVSGGAKLNAAGTAPNLVLFAKSGSIALSGGAQAVGLFYAPRSSLGISGNARIGGALFAKSVAITGDSNVIAAGEILPPELIASGGNPGKGGKTADFSAGGMLVAQGAADPSFQLRDLYAFPNPAVGGAKPVIHAAVGVADRVVVKIFDVSGRQTKEATLDGSPQVLDDGSGPKYAYEYTWDGHIPSGVYFYTIEAEKSGQKIRKAGRLAVVR